MPRCPTTCCWSLAAALMFCAGSVGCRWPGTDGPVSQSLLNCRQLSQQGMSALERGDLQTADELLSKAVATCPVDPEARRRYAEALLQRGHRREARGQLKKALEQSPEDATSWVRLAEIELSLENVAGAQSAANRALDLAPRSAEAWLAMGRVVRRAGDTRTALAHFHRALGYSPEHRESLLELAETYRELGEPQRALANLQTLADTYPPGEEPQQVMQLQGLAFSALGRFGEAVDVLAQARERAPPTPELLYQLAEVQLRVGQTQSARDALGQALSIEPQHLASRSLLEKLDVGNTPQAMRR